jgi:hypothetical protein
MPNPSKYKDKSEFMEDCMHQTRRVEKMPQDKSVAVCLNMWRDKDKKKSKKKEGSFEVLRRVAKKMQEIA